jgi:hypothetical protein
MTEHRDNLYAAAQMFNGIFQTAKDLASETISSDPNDEQVVGPLVEDQFNWHSCVGASQHCSEGSLLGTLPDATRQPEISRIHLDNAPNDGFVARHTVEQGRESAISFIQTLASCV